MPTIENTGVLILAGGKGSRLQPVVSNVPKPLAPIGGKPFLYWLLKSLKYHRFSNIVISSGYKGEQIQQFCSAGPLEALSFVVVKDPFPLGTGGAIRYAVGNSGKSMDYWLILNADTITTIKYTDLLSRFIPEADGLIACCHLDDTSDFGRLYVSPEGRIMRFEEKKGGAGWVNMGVYLLRRAIVEEIPMHTHLSLERTILPQAINNGKRFTVFRCDGAFADIGTPASYKQVERFLNIHFKELFGA